MEVTACRNINGNATTASWLFGVLGRATNAQPFHQGLERCALHAESSCGTGAPADSPLRVLERAQDMFPLNFLEVATIAFGGRRRRRGLLLS